MKNILLTATLLVVAIALIGCKKKDQAPSDPYLNVMASSLIFDKYAETKVVGVATNVYDLQVTVPETAASWCSAELTNAGLQVTLSHNYTTTQRVTTVAITSPSQLNLQGRVTVQQSPNSSTLSTIPYGDDIKIPVSSAKASDQQPSEPIELSFDGKMETHYHSRWSGATVFPVSLTYNFQNASKMDYLVYYTRSDGGSNGNIQELELWVASNGGALQKYGDYDFKGASAAISFDPPLTNPTQVEFRVKTGVGDGVGMYVSCAEMEFYQRAESSDDFDYLTIFTDHSCSELRPGVGLSEVSAIANPFFRDLAASILDNEHNASGFRVQEYRAWVHPDVQGTANKTSPYSLRDNPTGIYVREGEEFVVFVGNTYGNSISILTQDLSTHGFGTHRTYPIMQGPNKITAQKKGLIYVQYYSSDETAPNIKINFVSGTVNGYFDVQKHSADEWRTLLNNAVSSGDFDLVGRYAHLTFAVSDFKSYTPDGVALINKYDELVRLQHEFMGLYKYDRVFKNRSYLHVDYNPNTYMYATSYRTAYVKSSSSDILSLIKLTTTDAQWGPAHEVGHTNQVRPGVRWLGMTEVTTNIYSLLVQTAFGYRSRLHYDGVYERAFENILGQGIAHNAYPEVRGVSELFLKLVPFWQLKLYMHDVLGNTDFYPDLFYSVMSNPDPTTPATDGRYQLNFVRLACESAQLNLLDFFEAWGFLTPIDITMSDYSTAQFTITQASIDALKAEITAKGYPNPPKDFTRITDETVNDFR